MGSREDVAEAMAGLGILDDDIVSVVETPEASWFVRYEDCDVALDFQDEMHVLSLTTLLGTVTAERGPKLYATMLKYNAIRRETGGVVMALLPDERAVQTLDLMDVRITADLCATVLKNFVTKARIWRSLISSAEAISPGDQSMRMDELLSFGIRV